MVSEEFKDLCVKIVIALAHTKGCDDEPVDLGIAARYLHEIDINAWDIELGVNIINNNCVVGVRRNEEYGKKLLDKEKD